MSRRVLCLVLCLVALVSLAPTAAKDSAPAKKAGGIILFWEPAPNGVSTQRGVAAFNPDSKEMTWLVLNPRESPHLQSALSPDGRLLAYGIMAPNEHGGHGPDAIVHLKAMDVPKLNQSLEVKGSSWCWSPDSGKLLVNCESEEGIQHQLVDVNTRTRDRVKMPDAPRTVKGNRYAGYTVTDWSRDGKWLLGSFWSGDTKDKPRLYRIHPDGSSSELIEGVEAGGSPRLSPDGRQVLYGTSDGLRVLDLSSGKSHPVAQEKDGHYLGHCWSPDGKRIAYGWRQRLEKMEDEEVFIMAVNADGSNPTVLHSEKSFFPGLYVAGWR